MNVLVYSGPGSTSESVKHCLETLRRFLSPHYAVTAVNADVIRNEPWQTKTALLVVPGGADLPLCKEFNGEGNKIIRNFVNQGGKYIGFCSGGYYGAARCEFEVGDPEMEVSGPRELKFFPGTARGAAYKGFVYNSEAGARAVELDVADDVAVGDRVFNYYNGGAVFVDPHKYRGVEVLARYKFPIDVPSDETRAAVVYMKVGHGAALLTGTHPEFTPDLMKNFVEDANYQAMVKTIRAYDGPRIEFLKRCIKKLGLKVNDDAITRPRLTPIYLTSVRDGVIGSFFDTVRREIGIGADRLMVGSNDTFRVHDEAEGIKSSDQWDKQVEYEDPDTAIKELYVFPDRRVPDRRATPYFDLNVYYKTLAQLQDYNVGEIGSTLAYGEVVTSTSTMLDKNTNILRHLPNGFVLAGTTQVSGRGRGGNVWVNPPGVLAHSLVLRIPTTGGQLVPPIVLVQYLVSISIVEAVLSYGSTLFNGKDKAFADIPIKIKWPNDVYLLKPELYGNRDAAQGIEPSLVKICGCLVNTNILDKCYFLVVGTGINVSNVAPTTSLNLLVDKMNEVRLSTGEPLLEHFSEPKFLANFMTVFGRLFDIFLREGFNEDLRQLYYRHWLHSGQLVTVEASSNARDGIVGQKMKARITGISKEWGLLLADKLDYQNNPTGEKIELQPDGNSFDMFKGLISRKA